MPLLLSTDAIREKNKLNSNGIWHTLVEFTYGTETPIRVCLNNSPLTWDSKTWVPAAFELGELSETKEAELPTLQLRVFDPTRMLIPIVDEYQGAIGAEVVVYLVHSLKLGTSISEFSIDFEVTSTNVESGYVITFTLGSENLMHYKIPQNIYTRNFCRFMFKDNYCQYSGLQSVCDGSLSRCRELDNSERFGGFPGIPNGGIFV